MTKAERKQQTETGRAELRTPRVNRIRKETRPTPNTPGYLGPKSSTNANNAEVYSQKRGWVPLKSLPGKPQSPRKDGPPAPAQGRAALALPCHHQRAGAARHHPAGARRAAGQLCGRLRGVATPVYRSANCIPNKDCMRTWFEGVPLRLRRWVSTMYA